MYLILESFEISLGVHFQTSQQIMHTFFFLPIRMRG